MVQDTYTARAEALIEALPYIQKYRGALVVIKYGGSAMEDEHVVERLLRDLVFLEAVGINPILIHGGGKAISSRLRDAGIKTRFVNGLRVTCAESIAIVQDVLDNVINKKIVQTINDFGGKAVGLSGRSVFRAEKIAPYRDLNGEEVDYGFVGRVVDVLQDEIKEIVAREEVPVISPIGCDANGTFYNINADTAAGALAAAIGAQKLIYLSDVLGIMRDSKQPDSLIPTLPISGVQRLIEEGIIEGGMIPKVESAVAAIRKGVGKVHFIDGRIPHSLLLEIFTNAGIGTEIVA